MNAYEDICGMSTLGALNLGGDQDLPNMNQQALFKCMEIALQKTKQLTQLIRQKWDCKHKEFGLLDIQMYN